jgi:hypothetical protein
VVRRRRRAAGVPLPGGAPLVAGLSAAYWVAMGVSHPLAKKVGTWPSVLGVTAAAAGAAYVLADRRS